MSIREQLQSTSWDVCVVGDGAAALWTAHAMHLKGKSVLWVTNDELSSAPRMLAKHAWCGALAKAATSDLISLLDSAEEAVAEATEETAAENTTEETTEPAFPPFQAFYFDAKASKRFKPIAQSKPDWGTHELPWLTHILTPSHDAIDFMSWQNELTSRYRVGTATAEGTLYQIATEPTPFYIVRGLLVIGLQAAQDKITAIDVALPGDKATFAVKAGQFVLAEIGGESYAELAANTSASELLKSAQKGKSYRAGFSLHFKHSHLPSAIVGGALVVPLVAHPSKKGAGSHVVGRFFESDSDPSVMESVWFGLVDDEEVADNNEILKKMKAAKRVIDKTLPGFLDSVQFESMQFEPQMVAVDLIKKRPNQVLNALIVTDDLGSDAALKTVSRALDNVASVGL